MSFKINTSGSFENTDKFFKKMARNDNLLKILGRYGQVGVDALSASTPLESGLTADSWTYEVKNNRGIYSIAWLNTNMADGVPVAILLQYGHGTGTGGYVQGIDFINPSMRPIFDKIADDAWKAVTSA